MTQYKMNVRHPNTVKAEAAPNKFHNKKNFLLYVWFHESDLIAGQSNRSGSEAWKNNYIEYSAHFKLRTVADGSLGLHFGIKFMLFSFSEYKEKYLFSERSECARVQKNL